MVVPRFHQIGQTAPGDPAAPDRRKFPQTPTQRRRISNLVWRMREPAFRPLPPHAPWRRGHASPSPSSHGSCRTHHGGVRPSTAPEGCYLGMGRSQPSHARPALPYILPGRSRRTLARQIAAPGTATRIGGKRLERATWIAALEPRTAVVIRIGPAERHLR